MKKYLEVLLVLFVVIVGAVLWSQDVSAYYKKNKNGDACYAIQYRGTVDRESAQKSEGVQGALFSTKRLCYDGKTIYKDSYPSNATSLYSRPNFELIDDKTVEVTYCKKGDIFAHNVLCRTNSTKYSLNSYGGDFKKMTQAIQKEIESKGALDTGSRESIVAFDDNNATAEEGKTQYDEERAKDLEKYKSGSVCYDESGHLGWVFCPLIEGIGKAMSQLYDNIVEPFLVIEPALFNENGTYVAWDIFRNIANIVFVILFLVVIVSQLTGVGIDNYGIKKMLPKLITVAILVNLSYVICQLAVDLSNIIGNSLNTMFTSIATQINSNAASPADYFSDTLSAVMGYLGIGTVAAEVGVSVAPLIGLGFAAIIPVLLGLLSAIISVLFMFVILFVRKAVVILLVAVAPVAFVTYIMPNTKKMLFDKWSSLFKGALAVYPLAGALVGGGVLASSIILAATGSQAESGDADMGTFLLFIGALLLQVVPFFFLPRLFRSSLNAVGNLGNAITNRGAQFNGRARGAIEGSERLQDWQNRQRRNAMAGRAQRTIDRLGSRPLSGMSGRDQRRLLRAQRTMSAYSAHEANDFNDLYANMSGDQILAEAGVTYDADGNMVAKEVSWANDRNADQRMSSLVAAMGSRGMEDQMFEMLKKNNLGNMTRQALAGSNNKVARAFGKTGQGQSFDQFMANGGMKNYVDKKGADFLDGIDDKALRQINAYSDNDKNKIMSNDLIHEAQARVNSQDAVDQLDAMMDKGEIGNISGEQLSKFNASTVNRLLARADSDANAEAKLHAAAASIASDQRLASSMSAANKAAINEHYGSAIIP